MRSVSIDYGLGHGDHGADTQAHPGRAAMSTETYALIAGIAIAGAVFTLLRGVARARDADHRLNLARLEALGQDPGYDHSSRGTSGGRRRPRRGSASTPGRIRHHLRRAGLAWEPRDAVGVSFILGAVLATVAWAVSGGNSAVGGTAGVLGAMLPALLIKRRSARRAALLNAQVAETLEVVASSLRSGFGFTQSLELSATEQDDPISSELLAAIREINLGASTDEALQRLVERTGDDDLALAISAVIIQRKVGGDLSEVLANIAHMIRERVRIRGEIQTLTAQARMSAWIVGLLPIALAGALTVMQPDQMRILIDDPAGRMLVLVGLSLQAIGFLAVRRIAAIAY